MYTRIEMDSCRIVCSERKNVDLDCLNLLASGEIAELCVCSYKNEKHHHQFTYETAGMNHVSRERFSFEDAVTLLSNAVELVHNLRAREISVGTIRTTRDYIYRTDENYKFVSLPIVQNKHGSLRDFFLKMFAIIRTKDERIAHIIREVRKGRDDEEILAIITEFLQTLNEPSSMADPKSFATETETTLLSSYDETTLLSQKKQIENTEPMFDTSEETTLLSQPPNSESQTIGEFGSGFLTEHIPIQSSEFETTILSENFGDQQYIYENKEEPIFSLSLIRVSTGEIIPVDITPFTIGKDRADANYVVLSNSVSRRHATIVYEDGEYRIIDNASTNGTMVEGIRLEPNEKVELGNGFIIMLGNETFQVREERRK